jgi:D-xylose transport system ATP-binding protein
MSTDTPFAIETRDLKLTFGSVVALADASLRARRGEVTAIIGDNGAGKSSFVKCLLGINRPDSGAILVDGQTVAPASPREAAALGIEAVLQDLVLVDDLTLWQNMFLGRELKRGPFPFRLLDKRSMIAASNARIAALTKNVPDARRTVRDLSGGQRQSLAIARAVAWNSAIVLMDEPTAALGVRERADVEDLVLALKQKGRSLLIITHSFDQVLRVADAVWVMRLGRFIASRRVSETTGDELVGLVTGAIPADSG